MASRDEPSPPEQPEIEQGELVHGNIGLAAERRRSWGSDSRSSASETPGEHLISPAPSPSPPTSQIPDEPSPPPLPASPSTSTTTTTTTAPSARVRRVRVVTVAHPPDQAKMAESIYSYYSDSDIEDGYDDDCVSDAGDGGDDNDSLFDAPCELARTISFYQVGPPSIVDLIRAEKPVFKRASQVVVRRPQHRPFISPIQPPKNFQRSFSAPLDESAESSENESESSGSGSGSSYGRRSRKPSEPTTPTLDRDGSFTPTSDASPSTPDTPKTSFEQDSPHGYKGHDPETWPSPWKPRVGKGLRIFPKRSTTVSVHTEPVPKLPPIYAAHSSTTGLHVTPRSDSFDERETTLHVGPSPPDHAPLTARHAPIRSIWRDAGKSKFLANKLRKADARVGVNVH